MSEWNPILEKVRLEREELIHQQTESLRKLIWKISTLVDTLVRTHNSQSYEYTDIWELVAALTEMEKYFPYSRFWLLKWRKKRENYVSSKKSPTTRCSTLE